MSIEFEIRKVHYVYITKTLKNVEICKIHFVYIANTLKTCFLMFLLCIHRIIVSISYLIFVSITYRNIFMERQKQK